MWPGESVIKIFKKIFVKEFIVNKVTGIWPVVVLANELHGHFSRILITYFRTSIFQSTYQWLLVGIKRISGNFLLEIWQCFDNTWSTCFEG